MTAAEPSLWPFVVYFIAVLALVATMLGLSFVLGQRRANQATNTPFESGVLSVGSPQIHMSVEFYLVAIFFVIFDHKNLNGFIHVCKNHPRFSFTI